MQEFEVVESGGYKFAKFSNQRDIYLEKGIESIEAERHRIGFYVEPEEVWLDMGAYIGVFSMLVHKRGGIPIIFEPAPNNVEIIRKTMELNSLDFLLKESAVTHKGGQMKFYVDKNAPYNNSIFHYWKTPRQELVVDTIAFKDALELGYQYKRPVNVKMNIEGAEIEILENWSPDYDVDKIAFQWHFHIDNKLDRLRAVIEKLVSMGYDVVTAKDLPLDRDTWWDGRWDYIWVHCIRAGNLKLNENVKRNLVAVQRSIVGQEKSSVMARWEFGRMVAEQLSNTLSSGRKVRRDILIVKQILEETGISKSEMDHRLRLFLKYPNEDEVSAAIIQFPSWSAMIIDGLYEKRKITQNAHISLKRFSYEECSRKLQWLYENKRESLFLSEKITDILKLMFEEEREIVFDESQGFYLK